MTGGTDDRRELNVVNDVIRGISKVLALYLYVSIVSISSIHPLNDLDSLYSFVLLVGSCPSSGPKLRPRTATRSHLIRYGSRTTHRHTHSRVYGILPARLSFFPRIRRPFWVVVPSPVSRAPALLRRRSFSSLNVSYLVVHTLPRPLLSPYSRVALCLFLSLLFLSCEKFCGSLTDQCGASWRQLLLPLRRP